MGSNRILKLIYPLRNKR